MVSALQPFFTRYTDPTSTGSRDPLGLIPIWSRMGRVVVPNVRTTAADVQGWTTLLIGLGMVGRLRADIEDSKVTARQVLLRTEQLCGYARRVHPQLSPRDNVRGSTRMDKRLAAGGAVRVGEGPSADILTKPWSTGVWGQLGRSAIESRLIRRRSPGLEPAPQSIFDTLWAPAIYDPFRVRLRTLLIAPAALFEPRPGGRDAALARALALAHGHALQGPERPVFEEHILRRGVLAGQLADVLHANPEVSDHRNRISSVELWAQLAGKSGYANLDQGLRDIACVARLIGPAEQLFAALRARGQDQSPGQMAALIQKNWGMEALLEREVAGQAMELIATHTKTDRTSKALGALADFAWALAAGNWEEAVCAVIRRHEAVMRTRRGLTWIKVQDGRLDVIVESDAAFTMRQSALDRLEHSYYLAPFAQLVAAIRKEAA